MPKETFLRLWEQKQEHVMRTAIREFNKNGFARTTVEGIAQAAGIAKGSIYQYFEDKRDLFLYCAEWGLDFFMKKLAARMHMEDMDVFEYFLEDVAKTQVLSEERELALFMQLLSREPGMADDSMARMYLVADEYIAGLIQTSIKKGTVRNDIEEDLLKEYFIGITEQFKRRWMKRYIDFSEEQSVQNRESLDRELSQMLSLLKTGMGRSDVHHSGAAF